MQDDQGGTLEEPRQEVDESAPPEESKLSTEPPTTPEPSAATPPLKTLTENDTPVVADNDTEKSPMQPGASIEASTDSVVASEPAPTPPATQIEAPINPEPMVETSTVIPQQPVITPTVVTKPKPKKKRFLFGAITSVAVLLVGTAYYVLMYLPNTPENVYRRGMASIGVGLEELQEEEMFKAYDASAINAEFVMRKPTDITASIEGSGALTGEGELSIDATWDVFNPKFDFMVSMAELGYPKVFMSFDGVSEIIDTYLGPGIFEQMFPGQQLENIWWLIDYKDLIDNGLMSEADLQEVLAEAENSVTSEDYIKLMQAVIEASNEYVFTSESDNMVFERVEDLGVEAYEGVDSQKYLVEINKENLKSYLKLARDKVVETGFLGKTLPDYNIDEELSDTKIDEEVDKMDMSDLRIEAWVGLNNKVLRNLRFSPVDQTDTTGYLDISLLLDGTDLNVIPLRLKVESEDEDSQGTFIVNWTSDIKNNSTKIGFGVNVEAKTAFGTDVDAELNMSMNGLVEAPAYEIPTPSRSIFKLFESFAPTEDTPDVLGITSLAL